MSDIISTDDLANGIREKLKENISELIRLVEKYKSYPISNNEKEISIFREA